MRLFLSLVFVVAFSGVAMAEPQYGIAMHGEPALPENYAHFSYVNPDVKKGGEITYGVVGSFDSLNPFVLKGMRSSARGTWEEEIGHLVYEPLMKRSRDEPFTLYGLLAETVEWDDARSYIQFNLNPEARWSDGEPVTVEDVIFTFNLLQEKGRPPYNRRLDLVARMEKVGEHSVRFTFNDKANRETPLIFALMPVFPEHAIDPETFDTNTMATPVGSGPYVVNKVEPGQRIVYKRDPDYWAKDLPSKVGFDNYDTITIDYYLQDSTLFEAFKKGAVDVYIDNSPSHWARSYNFPAADSGDVVKNVFHPQTPTGMTGFVFNTRRPKFSDARVREALSDIFDFQWVNRTLFDQAYRRTESYWQNSALGAFGNPASENELELLGPTADTLPQTILEGTYQMPVTDGSGADRKVLGKAVRQLAEAGYKISNGKMLGPNGTPLAFEVMTTNENQEKLALAYQHTLKLIGIDMSIRTVDDAQYQKRLNTFDYDMMILVQPGFYYSSSLSPGAEQIWRWDSRSRDIEGTFNFAGVASPDIDRIIDAMLSARSTEKFTDSVRALDRLLVNGHYVLPLYHREGQWVARWKHIMHPQETPIYGYEFPTWWDASAQ
ncbi:extracellular solute-binding protein [Martelella mediterranea]|uniref:Peptide/nickel transport system substrate-binding protein n=1 Tax=Martelella mediterranea TaxID=293089 RepID=A0A4R3P0M1_9HYPH|nr:extracellular solute-binding protein [Martelella mediterranea]TCT39328.1 peptide/nickel transport system substrate-binding protein [Martelella mediterranea]